MSGCVRRLDSPGAVSLGAAKEHAGVTSSVTTLVTAAPE